tara:strand:+ start:905 stop:1411 length:507 start_codon:yes stop_codon:yes gene_type:complete
MFNQRLLGREQRVVFYRENGDFERQKKVFDRTMLDLIPLHCGYRSYKLTPHGKHMTMVFVVDPTLKLSEGQKNTLELLDEHGSVSYITQLHFVFVGEGKRKRLDFKGCFKKPNKSHFNRKSLDSLIDLGLVKMIRTIDHNGDFTRRTFEGSGFRIIETFRRPGESSDG